MPSEIENLFIRQHIEERKGDRTFTLQTPPFRIGASVYRSTNQAINAAAVTPITFDSVRFDYNPDGVMWSAGSPTRLTCVTPGRYLFIGNIAWESSATNIRRVAIRLGGATNIAVNDSNAVVGGIHRMSISRIYELAATNYVELTVLQNTAGVLNILVEGNDSAEFQAWRIG